MVNQLNKKFSIAGIGFFPDYNTPINGQSIRSNSVFQAISEKFDGNTIQLSYNHWKKNPFKVLIKFW